MLPPAPIKRFPKKKKFFRRHSKNEWFSDFTKKLIASSSTRIDFFSKKAIRDFLSWIAALYRVSDRNDYIKKVNGRGFKAGVKKGD